MAEFTGYALWFFEPRGRHELDCECEECHEFHIADGDVPEFAEGFKLRCCEDELESWIADKKWCKKHRNTYMDKGRCLECESPHD